MTAVPEALLWGIRRHLAAPAAQVLAVHRRPFAGGLSGSTFELWRLHVARAGVQSILTLVYKKGAVVSGALLRGAPQREALAYNCLPNAQPLAMPTLIAGDILAGDLWFLPLPPAKSTSHWSAAWDAEDVLATVADLASLHAAYWGEQETLARWDWLMQPTGRDMPALLHDARRGLQSLLESRAFDACLGEERLRRLQALALDPAPLLQILHTTPDVLLHGDAGFQNIAITERGRRRIWYDWQLAARGPAVLDLVTFLHPWHYPEAHLSLAPQAIIEHYLLSLRAHGIPLDKTLLRQQLDAAFVWRWLMQWAPLLGLYRHRLRDEVRRRLYHVFDQLHWPALDRLGK
ncbi:MAG: hypothetical protein D6775_00085 [Caldilineae bacterium]|nr:MAG: hypothetical protein D6775_00085 [Caldilineae bacterium]